MARNAGLDTLRELVARRWGAVTLIAPCGAFVGLYDLGGVGVGSSDTLGLAVHVGRIAREDTARRRRQSRSSGAGSSALLGNRPSGGDEGADEDGRVLHFDG